MHFKHRVGGVPASAFPILFQDNLASRTSPNIYTEHRFLFQYCESCFNSSSHIPCHVTKYCVFPNPLLYFGQITDPEISLPILKTESLSAVYFSLLTAAWLKQLVSLSLREAQESTSSDHKPRFSKHQGNHDSSVQTCYRIFNFLYIFIHPENVSMRNSGCYLNKKCQRSIIYK